MVIRGLTISSRGYLIMNPDRNVNVWNDLTFMSGFISFALLSAGNNNLEL